MSNNFLSIMAKANESRNRFDSTLSSLSGELKSSVRASKGLQLNKSDFERKPSTGWLKGSLSYPWAIVCIVIPAVLDLMM